MTLLFLVTNTQADDGKHSHISTHTGELKYAYIEDKKILYVTHDPENGHISNSLIKLVQFYLLQENDDYQVVFPQFSVERGRKEIFAIVYQGRPPESPTVKKDILKGGDFITYTYRGSYTNFSVIIPQIIRRIYQETNYKLSEPEEFRLLYWNSIDDNHPSELITEIQVRVAP